MDVKQYYRKIRELEARLPGSDVVVISNETADGGKAGVASEVSRAVAAKLIVEGRALVATDAQRQQYLERQAVAKKLAEKADLARRVQVAIISDADLKPQLALSGVDQKSK